MTKSTSIATPFGEGATAEITGDVLTLRIPIDHDRLAKCGPSASRKSLCVANSGGHAFVGDTAFKVNLYVGIPAKKLAALKLEMPAI